MSSLEQRLVFAAAAATTYEQFMLELINRARANPAAEAARLGIALNEGVTGAPISTSAKQPLAMNAFLTGAIRDHVQWLQSTSKFQHEGIGNSSPTQRITASGYGLTGSYGTAENLGLTLGSQLGDLAERVETIYKNLFIDDGIAGRGHRVNLLNGTLEEVGVGVTSGPYTYNNANWTAIIAGQDFAYRSGNPFLTGVVFEDKLKVDDFYSPGEGRNAVTITATSSGGTQYSATTGIAGGYSLQVPAGTYTVTASGGGLTGVATYSNVVVSDQNVKRDFEATQFGVGAQPPTPFASISNGTLNVSGTAKNDRISVLLEGTTVSVQLASTKLTFAASAVKKIFVNAGNGNDYVLVGETLPSASIIGGLGNDTIVGTASPDTIDGGDGNDVINGGGSDDILNAGAGNDTVNGEGGKDQIHGDDGNDRLKGAGGNDKVYGDADADRVYGDAGNDYVDGGSGVDRVYGDDGNDVITGGSSNDRLYGGDGDDTMTGGKGNDYFSGGAGVNKSRDRTAIESVLNVIPG